MTFFRTMGGLASVLLIAVCVSPCQTGSGSGVSMLISAPSPHSTSLVPTYSGGQSNILREIDDPQTGDCWLLMRDPAHPAGPGKLVLTAHPRRILPDLRQTGAQAEPALPVIRSRERVVLEEHSAVADAHLEAVALGPARTGDRFRARLALGNRSVWAVALGPGHALLQEATQ